MKRNKKKKPNLPKNNLFFILTEALQATEGIELNACTRESKDDTDWIAIEVIGVNKIKYKIEIDFDESSNRIESVRLFKSELEYGEEQHIAG